MSLDPLILIVEDEEAISNFISAVLNSNNYKVIKASNGKEAVTMAASYCPDVILLDLGLPDIDGIEVLKEIRTWATTPIIVVSARGHEREKVEALDLGADDYIIKPFGTSELLARIRAAIRHSQMMTATGSNDISSKITVGGMEINYEKRLITIDGKEVHLTPIEYKIICLLSQHLGKVLTHDFIVKEIWGPYSNEVQDTSG